MSSVDFDEFRRELLKRFFKTDSYFFLSLSTHLQTIPSSSTQITENDYLIIGQVVQKLIDADDPEQLLDELNCIGSFAEFKQTLDKTLLILHRPELPLDEMKHHIEELAHVLIGKLVNIIHEANENKQLFRILELPNDAILKDTFHDESAFDEGPAGQAKAPVSEKDEPDKAIAEQLFDENLFSEKHFETEFESNANFNNAARQESTFRFDEALEEDNAEGSKATDESVSLVEEEENDFLESLPPDFDSLTALPMGNPPRESDEKGRGAIEAEDTASQPVSEPQGLKRAFLKEANAAVLQIDALLEQLEVGKTQRNQWRKLRRFFLDLRESAMVHGFSELEEIAFKCQKVIERIQRNNTPLVKEDHSILQPIPRFLQICLHEKINTEDAEKLRAFATQLGRRSIRPDEQRISATKFSVEEGNQSEPIFAAAPDDTPDGRKVAGRHTRAQDLDEPSRPDELAVESAALEPVDAIFHDENRVGTTAREDAIIGEILDETLNADFFVQEPIKENDDAPSNLYLPGEDDPDLLKVIEEVTGHSATASRKPEAPLPSDTAHASPGAIHGQKLQGSPLEQFKQEAELYFRVVDEAVDELVNKNNNRLALENLELAAYSMKILARKLGIESWARFPEHVEELIRKILLLQLSPNKGAYHLIKKGFTLLKNAADIQDVEAVEIKEVEREILRYISSIEELGSESQEKKHAADSPSAATEVKQFAPRASSFRLRSRQVVPEVSRSDEV